MARASLGKKKAVHRRSGPVQAAQKKAQTSSPSGVPLHPGAAPLARLLARAASGSQSPEEIQAVNQALVPLLTNPKAIARCELIPAEHPLRVQAGLVSRGLLDVIEGEEHPDVVAGLSEIPRRSPWAPYVLLISAIRALYAGKTDVALRLAQAIPQNAPASRVAAVLRSAVDPSVPLQGVAARRLAGNISSRQRLLKLLEALTAAVYSHHPKAVPRLLADLEALVRPVAPELMERILDGVYSLVVMRLKEGKLGRGWQVLSDRARLCRTIAIVYERDPETSLQAWMHYAQLATLTPLERSVLLSSIAERTLLTEGFCTTHGVLHLQQSSLFHHDEFYDAFVVDDSKPFGQLPDLNPEGLYRASLKWAPRPPVFQALATLLETRWRYGLREAAKLREDLYLQWAEASKSDPAPHLALARLAHESGHTRKAVTSVEEAAKRDPVNPEVRHLEMVCLLSSALRRLKLNQLHLVSRDLAAMDAHPNADDKHWKAIRLVLQELVQWLLIQPSEGSTPRGRTPSQEALGSPGAAGLLFYSLAALADRRDSGLSFEWSPLVNLPVEGVFSVILEVKEVLGNASQKTWPVSAVLHTFVKLENLPRKLDLAPSECLELAVFACESEVLSLARVCVDEILLRGSEDLLPRALLIYLEAFNPANFLEAAITPVRADADPLDILERYTNLLRLTRQLANRYSDRAALAMLEKRLQSSPEASTGRTRRTFLAGIREELNEMLRARSVKPLEPEVASSLLEKLREDARRRRSGAAT